MTKEEFKLLFEHALEIAAENASKQVGKQVPRAFEIELHGFAPHSRIMTSGEALEVLYLGPDRFFPIVNVSVIRVRRQVTTVFVCISGHGPGPLSETWNQPPGSGPFKQLLASGVVVTE